ncbi:MAG TPA: HAMP domain-containing sensor histidine kinase [Steroidobacteraceae bacterium]|nr:HAMP domain-containing sensor histidine kinase [Steroidobacteraceae bacterium]
MFVLRRFNNESARLSALLIGLFAASALLLGNLVYLIAGQAIRAELHDFISADAGAVSSGYRGEGLSEAVEVVQQLTAAPGVSGRYLLQSRDGHKLAGDLDAMPARSGMFEFRADGRGGGRGVHDVLGQGGFLPDGTYLFVGQNTDRLAGTRARILRSFGWIIGATLILAIAGGALLSASFLRRIDAMTRTCRAVVGGQFGERIPIAGSRGQLDRLSGTINEMLDRIATLLESLRQVSSDIAHDLRTPLTRLRQRLESARGKDAGAADYERVMEGALADCDAILTVFSALLRISQIESGSRLANFAPVDLSGLLGQVAELFAPVAEDGQQRLVSELDQAGGSGVHADRTLLLQMFSNLVENAIRHAGRGAIIRIRCRQHGADAVVQIVDSGPGIPPSERDKVFNRLYRLERSRNTPGNGLGLALVAAIAKLHRFTITLSDARPGLCVSIQIGAAGGLPT